MNFQKALTIAIAMQCGTLGAALAEDPVVNAPAPATVSNGSPVTKPHKSLFLKAISIIPATLIGTPVNWVKKPIDEEKYTIGQATNDSHNPKQTVSAGILWAPFAMITGVLEAPFFALDNALRNCDQPFSKAQFSLTEGDTTTDEPIHGQTSR